MTESLSKTLTQEKLTERITTASSWADMVRSIEHEKRKDLNMAEFQPTQRVTMFDKKRSERIVDPVAMKFRDPARESEYQAKKESAMADRVRVARQEISQKFNILNHQGPPRKIEKDPPRVLGASKREFHLLTNMKIDDHVSAPIIYNDNYVQEKTKRPPRVLPFTAPNRREFDVISNNYYTDNEVRQVRDKEAIKEHVEDVYWKTHDYDLLKGEFYSKEKEDDFQEQRRLVSSVQGLSQQYRLPPSYKYSEGNSFNILHNAVTSDDRMRVTEKLASGHTSHACEIQKKMREEGNRKQDLDEARRLNRPKFNRWESEVDRGYGLIDNLPKQALLPRPARPATVWTRLQETSSSSRPDEARSSFSRTAQRSAGHTPMIRNLSDNSAVEPGSPSFSSQVAIHDFSYRAPASGREGDRQQSLPSSAPSNTSRLGRPIPSLDLAKAEPPEPVVYREVPGPPGLAIPMVRTGGL